MSTDSRFEQPQQQRVEPESTQRFQEQAWGPQGRVPQEFCRPNQRGEVINIYIDHADINMANGRPEFRQCDPNVRRMEEMRRIQYCDNDRYNQQYYRNDRDDYYCRTRQPHCPSRYERPPVYVQPPYVYVEPPQVYIRPPQVYYPQERYYPQDRYETYPQVYSAPGSVYSDTVHGGRDGYTASRTRANSGYYGGERDDFDRVTDLGFGIVDRIFANDAARRSQRRR